MVNRVVCKTLSDVHRRVVDLIGDNYSPARTAFIGQCGEGPEHALYLLCYSAVVLAADPGRVWTCLESPVLVEYFVDPLITVETADA